jgi:hypothetical protein
MSGEVALVDGRGSKSEAAHLCQGRASTASVTRLSHAKGTTTSTIGRQTLAQ